MRLGHGGKEPLGLGYKENCSGESVKAATLREHPQGLAFTDLERKLSL